MFHNMDLSFGTFNSSRKLIVPKLEGHSEEWTKIKNENVFNCEVALIKKSRVNLFCALLL